MLNSKKGKIGYFSIIDILLVLALLFSIAGFSYYALSKNEKATNLLKGSGTVTYTLDVKNIEKFVSDKISMGDLLYETKAGAYIGKIVSKTDPIPFSDTTENIITGEYINSIIPNKYFTTLTISSSCDFPQGVVTVNGEAIKIGKTLIIKSDTYVFTGTIVALKYDKANEVNQ